MSHYSEAEAFVRIALEELDPAGNAVEVRRSFDAAKVHATLAAVDQVAELAELLAAWRADIDSVPHINVTAADLTAPRKLCKSQHYKPHVGTYVCSRSTGHDGQHQATVDGEVVDAWRDGSGS